MEKWKMFQTTNQLIKFPFYNLIKIVAKIASKLSPNINLNLKKKLKFAFSKSIKFPVII